MRLSEALKQYAIMERRLLKWKKNERLDTYPSSSSFFF